MFAMLTMFAIFYCTFDCTRIRPVSVRTGQDLQQPFVAYPKGGRAESPLFPGGSKMLQSAGKLFFDLFLYVREAQIRILRSRIDADRIVPAPAEKDELLLTEA